MSKKHSFLIGVAGMLIAMPALAQERAASAQEDKDMVTTAVAKGRDRLDSAISTSSLKQADIQKLGSVSVGEILRDLPGIRSEADTGEGNANISIRGLPMSSSGAKYVQLQEDGLPVLEFGDLYQASSTMFLRADLNLAQIESIRGGSASTFASNSPGGVINFMSKTGDVEGGSIQATTGLDYERYRMDFDYGAKLNDTMRFHVGGFYRTGEGPRNVGYRAEKGGQIKVNVTKEFAGGYVRFYGKYLDDRTPYYYAPPVGLSGTDGDIKVTNIANVNLTHDTLSSRYFTNNVTLDGNNNLTSRSLRDGQHAVEKSIGLESRFDMAGWTVIERFRFASMGGDTAPLTALSVAPAAALAARFGGAGATLRYATGPQAGSVITDPSALNGNGLLAFLGVMDNDFRSLDNVTNDLRLSRVWEFGKGDLTTTAGIYNSRQKMNVDWLWTTVVSDVRGNGESALVDIVNAAGTAVTQDGFFGFGTGAVGGAFRRSYNVDYRVNAPFASANYHVGRVSVGGSLRYDFGGAEGSVYGVELGNGRVGLVTRDINGDGVISPSERQVSVLPLTRPAPVNYDFHYLSYSTGINFRVSEPFAVFGRYSRGGRVNADRILFSRFVNSTTGGLNDAGAGVDFVKQAEVGAKYRKGGMTLNLTGFWARSEDTNFDNANGSTISREYRATGLEFEGGFRRGVFSLTGGATYTDATIVKDNITPADEGNTPRHQAKFIFQATPQISTSRFSVGAVFIGTTGSFAQEVNQLRMPGFVTTNGFVQVRATDRVTLSVNASNLFDVTAFTGIDNPTVPATGVGKTRVLNPRAVSASVKFDF